MAKVTVELFGILAIEEELTFEVDSIQEAMLATLTHLRKLKPELFYCENKLKIQIVGYDTEESLKEKPKEGQHLRVLPSLIVGKKAGFFQIIIGATLIAASFFIDPTGTTGAMIANALFTAGTALVVGGTLQLLAPVPIIDTIPEEVNPEVSKYLSGAGNTTKHGTRIALAGGTVVWYGHILSVNIQARDLAIGGYTAYPTGVGKGSSGSVIGVIADTILEEQN